MRRRQSQTTKGRLNPVPELSGRQIDRVKKLPREAERRSIHSLGVSEPSLVMFHNGEGSQEFSVEDGVACLDGRELLGVKSQRSPRTPN